jgi:hypothetical protein
MGQPLSLSLQGTVLNNWTEYTSAHALSINLPMCGMNGNAAFILRPLNGLY